MSSTKPEVHNALHCRHRRIEPQVACAENLVKFGHAVLEICKRTYRQTDRQQTNTLIAILHTPPGSKDFLERYDIEK